MSALNFNIAANEPESLEELNATLETSTAQQLAQQYIIIDTHIDVPYRLHKDWEDVTVATQRGEFDYPRAKAGGPCAQTPPVYCAAQ